MKKIYFITLLIISALLNGCIRMAGGASVWRQNDNGPSTVKAVSFDTQRLISEDEPSGSIST